MKISIAMATYNGAQYVQEQLQSFVDQTRQPDELIITDDCSTDQTEAIVREFAKTVPFTVEFHHNVKNLGYCGNFNAALMKTTGDLVFLSDQDDVWFPEKIEHMINVAEHNPHAWIVMNDAALTDGELNEVGLTKVGQIRSAGLPLESFVMGCCCAVRRELLNLALPIPAGFRAHDSWLVRIADGLDAKVVDDTPLQYYRRHEANESQFIANRTTKVTRLSRLLHTASKIKDPDTPRIEQRDIEQQRIFAQGVEAISQMISDPMHSALIKLKDDAWQRAARMEKRVAIRRRWMLPRVLLVLQYCLNGGYRGEGGGKAFVRDLVG